MNKKKPRNKCRHCGEECKRPQGIYCSSKCQSIYNYKKYIHRWQTGRETGFTKKRRELSAYIRRYLLERSNSKCEKCGWGEINPFTKKVPIEVHHIDGHYYNCTEKNLVILCPNCHSLTDNYKASNKGKGNPNLKRKKGDKSE